MDFTLLNILLVGAAGVLSFLSPCVLPLVPSYLGFISPQGVNLAETGNRTPILRRTIAFVLGFSVVFVAMGLVFSSAGFFLSGAQQTISIVAGIIIIFFGLNTIFDLIPALNYEKRAHVSEKPVNTLGAFIVGTAFGAGWSPCIGPMLASVLLLAGSSAQLGQATVFLIIYSLGLGIPFLLVGLFLPKFEGLLSRIRNHPRVVKWVSGSILILMGLLISLGQFQGLSQFFGQLGFRIELWNRSNPQFAQLLSTTILGIFAGVILIPSLRSMRRSGRKVGNIITLIIGLGLTIIGILNQVGHLSVIGFIVDWFSFQGI